VDRLSRVGSGRVGATREQVALRIYEALKRPVEVCSTGLLGLDQAMGGGLFPGKLYGIGARKKVGKTGLLGSISFNVNELEVRHLCIALEMSDVEIEQQNIARAMGFNSARFLKPDRDRLLEKVGTYVATAREKNHTLYEHVPGARFAEIRRLIARAHQRGIKGVVLDYLQLIGGRNPKETEEYHHRICAQMLADIARQLGIWIVVACQLNQEGNTRGGEGLRLACDHYYVLHRDKGYPGAWLEMQDSRYTAYANVGSESSPGLWLRWNGPHFSEDPPRVNEWPSLDAEHE
jgi:replicative DNA helicase